MKIIQNNQFKVNTIVSLPPAELKNIVSLFFEIKGRPSYKTHRILPRGTSEILFNFGDNIWGSSALNNNINCKYYLCSGIRTSYFDSMPTGFMDIVGIRFTINGWFMLFNIPPYEMKNEDQNLDFILGKTEADMIAEKLFCRDNAFQRFSLLENWIIGKLSSRNQILKNDIINLILQKPFCSIKEIEKYSGYSRQYLHRLFKSRTGLTPKEYLQIKRFLNTVEIINNSSQQWMDIVYKLGYFDQSHFVKSFKRFSGFSPTEYLSKKINTQYDPFIF